MKKKKTWQSRGKFKRVVEALKKKVIVVTEKLTKKMRNNISVSTTIEGRRPNRRRHIAIT